MTVSSFWRDIVPFMIKRTGSFISKNLNRRKEQQESRDMPILSGPSINEKTGLYKTLEGKEKFCILSEEEFAFFKEAEKTDDSIKTFEMDMQRFLYTNWKEIPYPIGEEICNMIQNILRYITKMQTPIDVYPLLEEEDYDREIEEEKPWDLPGSVLDCLLRYAEQPSPEEIEKIICGMEDGLRDKEIQKYFAWYDVEKYRKVNRLKF